MLASRSVQALVCDAAVRYCPSARLACVRALHVKAKAGCDTRRVAVSSSSCSLSRRQRSLLSSSVAARPESYLKPDKRRQIQTAEATALNEVVIVAEGLEIPLVALYLLTIVGILGVGAFLVSRQVIVKAELDNTAKELQENVRLGNASPGEYFELGAIYLRKKLFVQASKNLQIALNEWDGEEVEKAQIYNALGYASFGQEKFKEAEAFYKQAVALQPGYVTAWTNLANCYESQRRWELAVEAYEQAAALQPENDNVNSRLPEVRRKALLKIE